MLEECFFKIAPDFENKKDFALGNEYEIVVEAMEKNQHSRIKKHSLTKSILG